MTAPYGGIVVFYLIFKSLWGKSTFKNKIYFFFRKGHDIYGNERRATAHLSRIVGIDQRLCGRRNGIAAAGNDHV